jgi:hypothetical protein
MKKESMTSALSVLLAVSVNLFQAEVVSEYRLYWLLTKKTTSIKTEYSTLTTRIPPF